MNDTHVYIQDATDRAFGTVSYSKRVPYSLDYAKLVCTAQARALTETFHGRKTEPPMQPAAPPDDLTFKVELWFDDDSNIQQTLARTAKVTHAKQFVLAIGTEYAGRNLKIRQGIRVIWETSKG